MKFILKHMHEGQSKIAYNAQNTNEIYTGPIYTNACRTQMQETCSNRTKPNQNTPGITELSNDADDALFQRVLYRPNLVLQYLLQDRESNKYCLRYRSHTKELD